MSVIAVSSAGSSIYGLLPAVCTFLSYRRAGLRVILL